MANDEHLEILRKGVEHWNDWYREFCDMDHGFRARLSPRHPDLSGWDGDFLREFDWLRFCFHEHRLNPEMGEARARYEKGELSPEEIREGWIHMDGIQLGRADMQRINLSRIWLRGADLSYANLSGANLSGVDLSNANLCGTKLHGANLSDARLDGANLSGADLFQADLSNANLSSTVLVSTVLDYANLTNCNVYGLSAWDVRIDGTIQKNLRIASPFRPEMICVDDLEVAQFIYLLLNNKKIRQVIDTVTSTAVLILGRFTAERKAVLDALRGAIRKLGYLPILFDFDPAATQTRMETVSTLAHLSRFVIADITDAKTVLQELQGIVPTAPALPVQPILLSSQDEPGMFDYFRMYPWVLPTVYYDSTDALLLILKERVLKPADGRAKNTILKIEEARRSS